MFCEQCGHKLRENARFCEYCGWKVNFNEMQNNATIQQSDLTNHKKEIKNDQTKQHTIIGIGVIALILVCVVCYFAFFHVDPKVAALDGLWKPMDDAFNSDIEIHRGVMTFYDQEGKIKDCDDSTFIVEYKDGSIIKWNYELSEHGLMWLCYQIEYSDTEDEYELDYKVMSLYYNDDKADERVRDWYDYSTSIISVMDDTDSNDLSYKDYLADGIWCAEEDQDTFDMDMTDYISFEWNDDGSYHTEYRLPRIQNNGEENSLVISSMDKLISSGGSYLISMVPLEEDLCAVYFYGDAYKHSALFSRF